MTPLAYVEISRRKFGGNPFEGRHIQNQQIEPPVNDGNRHINCHDAKYYFYDQQQALLFEAKKGESQRQNIKRIGHFGKIKTPWCVYSAQHKAYGIEKYEKIHVVEGVKFFMYE